MSTISGQAEFNDSDNNGTVNGAAVFTGDSSNTGTVDGNATFTDNSQNNGTVDGNAAFYDNTVNNGEITEMGAFAESAQNNGDVSTLVTEPPSIATQPIGLCATGGNVTLTASASGYFVNHKWVVDNVEREENEGGGVAADGTSATLNLSINQGQQYKTNVKCRFYNPIGSVDTAVAVVNVGTPAIVQDPHVAVGPGQETYNRLDTLKVSVEGFSYADKVYLQFQVNSGPYEAFVNYGNISELATSGSATTNFSGLLDSGITLLGATFTRARVRVYDCFGNGNITNSWWTYFNELNIDPPTIIVQPISGSAYAGEYVTFTVEADDNLPGENNSLMYQWKFGQTPIAGATGSTLNIQIPFGASEGSSMGAEYTCIITSPYNAYPTITTPVTATSLGQRPPPPENSQPPE